MTNPYNTLGVDENADQETIARAFKVRAKETHLDTGHCTDAEDFRQVQEAYMILRDPEKRKQFDETGAAEEEKSNALNELLSLYVQACQESGNGLVSPMQIVKEGIASAKKNLVYNQKANLEEAAKIYKMIGRTKKKSQGINLFAMALEHAARQLEKAADKITGRLEVIAEMEAILEDYDFEMPQPRKDQAVW